MLPRRWAPSVTRSSLTSDGATTGSTRARKPRAGIAGVARRLIKDSVLRSRASSATGGSAIMARRERSFVCQNCGAAYSRWQGKCDACGEWNTIAEENSASPQSRMPRKGRLFALEALAGTDHEAPRLASGLAEFDRVTG